MVRAAYAPAYHWACAAGRTLANESREWMLSHVHAVHRPRPTLHSTTPSCLADVARRSDLQDFDRAYAHEVLGWAVAAVGRVDEARELRLWPRGADRRRGGPQDLRRRPRGRALVLRGG